MQKVTKKRNTKKIVLISLAAVFVLVVFGLLYWRLNGTSNTVSPDGITNLSPATEEDKQRAEDNKQDIVNKDEELKNQQSTPAGTKKSVTPIITYADQNGAGGQIEVGATVSGIFEDGGSCTAKFVNGSASVAKTVVAVKNARDVSCPMMSASATELTPKGTWSLSVSYDSSTSSGSSATREIEVN